MLVEPHRIEWEITLTIYGEPASKANSRRLVTHHKTGRKISIKSDTALGYLRDLQLQVPKRKLLTGQLEMWVDVFYASRRPDLDVTVIEDGLQGRVYENDRQLVVKHARKFLDKKNPRAIVYLRSISLPEQGTA